METNRDNPVPSLDKTYEIYFAEGSYGFAHEKGLPKESPIFDTFLEKIGEFTCNKETLNFILKSIDTTAKWFNDLKNGVETEKS